MKHSIPALLERVRRQDEVGDGHAERVKNWCLPAKGWQSYQVGNWCNSTFRRRLMPSLVGQELCHLLRLRKAGNKARLGQSIRVKYNRDEFSDYPFNFAKFFSKKVWPHSFVMGWCLELTEFTPRLSVRN